MAWVAPLRLVEDPGDDRRDILDYARGESLALGDVDDRPVAARRGLVWRVYFNKTEAVPVTSRSGRRQHLQRRRAEEEWIAIPCSSVVSDEVFAAAQAVSRDNSMWSPRNIKEEAWLLRGLVTCGACHVGTTCHKMRGRNGTFHRYYSCRHHDPLRAGGEAHRCPERNIRADALDSFVFEQVRAVLLSLETLHAGEAAIAASTPVADDELLGRELGRIERKLESNEAERRRFADLYQAGLLELTEVQRRARDIEARHRSLEEQRDRLLAERQQLAKDNRLRQRVGEFAAWAARGIDKLNFEQRQQLLRLFVERVEVQGWKAEIHLRIPLGGGDGETDDGGDCGTRPPRPPRMSGGGGAGCQAKTVCVPFVHIDGESYRMRAHQARSNELRQGAVATSAK